MSITAYSQARASALIVSAHSDLRSVGTQIPLINLVSFEFDEDAEKADMLKLQIRDPNYAISDSGILDPGNFISFSWGYPGGKLRGPVFMLIMGADPDYPPSGDPVFTVIAYDQSISLGNRYQSANHGKISRSDVAQKIALKHGLIPKIDSSDTLKRDIMQPPSLSDMQFLVKLANEINFACYIENNVLFFVKKSFDDTPKMKLIYRNPTGSNLVGTLIDFRPKTKIENRPTVSSASDGTGAQKGTPDKQAQANLGDKMLQTVNNVTGAIASFVKPGQAAGTKHEPYPNGDPDRLKSETQAKVDKMNESNVVATATALGDVVLTKNIVIEFDGLGKRFSGNWYVKNANHKIDHGGYITKLSLKRQGVLGSGDKVSDAQGKVNDKKASSNVLQISNTTGSVTEKMVQ